MSCLSFRSMLAILFAVQFHIIRPAPHWGILCSKVSVSPQCLRLSVGVMCILWSRSFVQTMGMNCFTPRHSLPLGDWRLMEVFPYYSPVGIRTVVLYAHLGRTGGRQRIIKYRLIDPILIVACRFVITPVRYIGSLLVIGRQIFEFPGYQPNSW
jgi:hypothetical protein